MRAPSPLPLRLQIIDSPQAVSAAAWNALLARQATPTPFMRHEYLSALHTSDSAVPRTGWVPRFALLWDGPDLAAACPLYVKSHSYGEYVFDWAWAHAYEEHDLPYYPKAVIAVPFTPVPGSRLLARDAATRRALIDAVRCWCEDKGLSSLHVLFGDTADHTACNAAGLMRREQVQFHWKNMKPPRSPAARGTLPPEGAANRLGNGPATVSSPPRLPAALPGDGSEVSGEQFSSFDDFLTSLTQDKRKKIRQERRKVQQAGMRFRWARGADISPADWAFFYRCYERTYLEHGNPPYLNPAFFTAMAQDMAEHWVLFTAERDGTPIATSLIAINTSQMSGNGQFYAQTVAYGRYWGALERVDSLHFEACYYQPLQWCIAHGVARFEGGAQGEHKMARALMPVVTESAHWLAHPAFAQAVDDFLHREGAGVARYMAHLQTRTPFRQSKRADPTSE
ncbi:GNAT family N-acetyltransferase [Ottowia sp.]|uniref:GNAT family N-acetyltransferase n=1 Tax=Ottowia sp. TaxID=1898956 RepID=UPI003A8A0B01